MKALRQRRVKAPTRLQYEATECGAAALATVLAYFGRIVPLSDLRRVCGVGRDGSNAKQLLQAGRHYGLTAQAYRYSAAELQSFGRFPCVAYWRFNHFLVLEGFEANHAYLSDPAQGRVRVGMEEFLDSFTGLVLEFEPGSEFSQGGSEPSPLLSLPAALRPYWHALLLLLLGASGQGVLTLLVAGLTSSFIDGVLQNQHLYFGIPIVWMLLLSLLAWLALLVVQFVLLRRLTLLLSKRLASDLFRRLFQLTFAFFQARLQGEIASRLFLGLETTEVIVGQLLRFVLSLWMGVLVLLVSLAISVWLSLLVLVVMVANLLLNWWLTERRYDANRKLSLEQGRVQGKSLQGINNLEILKASGLEFDFLAQWQSSFATVVTQNQVLGAQMAIASITANASTLLLNALILLVGGLLIMAGKMSLGSLVAFQFLQVQLTAPINTLPQLSTIVQRLIGDLGRLDDLKQSEKDPLVCSFAQPDETRAPLARVDVAAEDRLCGTIELRKLCFGFDAVSAPFIDNLDLLIPAGTHLSIVGSSGSGKTTLIRLLAGLYQPSEGCVLFDGQPWSCHGDRLMRASLAYVPQQVFVFNASVQDNITLWRQGYSLDQLEHAARDAQFLDAILGHPEAFQRQLRDNGSDLSGGERQRLELCRALLRLPSILLLDEGTSALDNATQSKVFEMLAMRRITLISIAHRLDVALRSDQVLVMHNGAIAETGAPDQLLDQQGAFAALVQSERRGQDWSS